MCQNRENNEESFKIHISYLCYSWYKDGEIMPLSRMDKRRQSLQVGDVLQLIIRDVNVEDSGLYTLDINGQKLDAILTINGRFNLGAEPGVGNYPRNILSISVNVEIYVYLDPKWSNNGQFIMSEVIFKLYLNGNFNSN